MLQKKPVRVIGFPFCLGGGGKGTSDAPRVLVENGFLRSIQKTGRECIYEDLSVPYPSLQMKPAPTSSVRRTKHVMRVRNAVRFAYIAGRRIFQNGEIPVYVGGDHSFVSGTILASLASCGDRLRVIYIDQHLDGNTPETTKSGNAHGMSLALALGFGNRFLLHAGGLAPKRLALPPSQLLHVGADFGSIEWGEERLFERLGVRRIMLHDIMRDGLSETLNAIADFADGHPLHVSFDVDATNTPATGYPNPFGYTRPEIVRIAEEISHSGDIVGLDVVEYIPDKDVPDVDGASYETINTINATVNAFFS